jgi:cellulose synthase/poly-beta-1,6-N-acetylglucosamine synthase-like glycosyltransferase
MKLLLLWLFWTSAAVVVYTYIIFPVLVFLRGLLSHRPYKSAEITPAVSLIIAAYNEAGSIGAKLDNVLALDYPSDRLQVLVASDGSDDGTDAIVGRYTNQGINLLSLPRQGKAPALNAAAAAATGEILVFSDANSIYAPDAIRSLVRPFADPAVGGVAGNQRYLPEHNGDKPVRPRHLCYRGYLCHPALSFPYRSHGRYR